jgi:UDP-2,3-diacylglucosamine pyrophosphatase LpxH
MNIPEALDKVLEITPRHDVPSDFKGFFISDLHMGVRDEADDFLKNSKLCYDWLETYFQAEYTLFLLGDIYDIWKNPDFSKIVTSYSGIARKIEEYKVGKRAVEISGNHDGSLPFPNSFKLVFPSGKTILLVHGHQGDFFNDQDWFLGEFFVRYIWRNLEMIGFKDPTTAVQGKNPKKHELVKAQAKEWARSRKQILIMGHTHFSECEEPYYWNTGSWVGKGGQGVEIVGEEIKLKHFS